MVQHNALVNAEFNLNTTETRLFMAMLTRLSAQDGSFLKCQVIVRDIMDHASNNYSHVRKMLDGFASRKLRIETLSPEGHRPRQRTYKVIPFLAYAEYKEGAGQIEARFNDELLPYLLELSGNFTKAQLAELLKLKGASSFRIYWLLREYDSFGKRVIALSELKAILGLTQEYDRFNNFRLRVLDKAQEELAATDLPFTYTPLKQGRQVTHIEFRFRPPAKALAPTPLADWEAALLAVGVSAISLPQIQARLTAGDYDIGYIRFVLTHVKGQVQAGKVRREAGAVFQALVDKYLLSAYHSAQLVKARAYPPSQAQVRRQRKLSEALDEALNSRRFVLSATVYTDETRPAALQQVEAKISQLRMELQACLTG